MSEKNCGLGKSAEVVLGGEENFRFVCIRFFLEVVVVPPLFGLSPLSSSLYRQVKKGRGARLGWSELFFYGVLRLFFSSLSFLSLVAFRL